METHDVVVKKAFLALKKMEIPDNLQNDSKISNFWNNLESLSH